MALTMCAACRRHHDPSTACPFCAGGPARALPISLGGALLVAAASALGCVGQPAEPAAATRALVDTIPPAPVSPTPTPLPTPATTYGLPPPRRRKG